MVFSYIDLGVITTVVLAAAGFLWRQMVKMDERRSDQIDKMDARHREQMEKLEERLREVIRDLHQIDVRLARIEGSRHEQLAAVQQSVPGGGDAADTPAEPPRSDPDTVEPRQR